MSLKRSTIKKKSPVKDFETFIRNLLLRGNLNDKHIDMIMKKENMAEFKIAFTHPSAGEEKDYQLYEFLGDVVINEFVAFYLRERFPKVISVKWITRLKHNLISKKALANIAIKEGLEKFVIYGEDIAYLKANPHLDEKNEYVSMLEDVMEAFCGCLSTVIIKEGKLFGTATEICRNILKSFFDAMTISLEYEDVFDSVTILKELYETKTMGLEWPNDQVYLYSKKEGPIPVYSATVYGWPLGDRKPRFRNQNELMKSMHRRGKGIEDIPKEEMDNFAKHYDSNKIALATEFGINKKDAKEKAARKALEVLKSKYQIRMRFPDPYEKKKYDASRSKLEIDRNPELQRKPEIKYVDPVQYDTSRKIHINKTSPFKMRYH